MPMTQLLFSLQGRLNRKPWWLTNLAIAAIVFVLLIVAFMSAGGATTSGDPAALYRALGGLIIVFLILLIPFIWIAIALGGKRLHDRNKSAWWLVVFYIVPSVIDIIGQQMGAASLVFSVVSIAISIWGLIELGFLRGTVGPNQYGPDPLEGGV